MEHVRNGYRSLSLLMSLNSDRILYIAMILFALALGSFFGSVLN